MAGVLYVSLPRYYLNFPDKLLVRVRLETRRVGKC